MGRDEVEAEKLSWSCWGEMNSSGCSCFAGWGCNLRGPAACRLSGSWDAILHNLAAARLVLPMVYLSVLTQVTVDTRPETIHYSTYSLQSSKFEITYTVA